VFFKKPHLQRGTCYANDTATIIRAAEARIIGRQIESHKAIVQRLVDKYGEDGAQFFSVLRKECKKKNLRCSYVSLKKAEKAIREGRALIMVIHMPEYMWDDFHLKFLE
jgi:hypothetical protein